MSRAWTARLRFVDSEPRETFRRVLAVAVWFGLVVGLAEGSIRTIQSLIFGRWTFISEDVVWMAPLADVAFYIALALVLFLVGQLWPAAIRRPVLVFAFTLIAVAAPLLFISALHKAAAVLLATGLAVQGARLVRRRAAAFDAIIRRSSAALAILVVGLGVGLMTYSEIAEQRALAALPPVASGSPNVVLIILDTVRAANVGFHGYARNTTPELDEFARRGVVFERAVSTAPWTLPAHASMFTGRYPFEVSANWLSPLDGRFGTLAEALRDRGYVTAAFVANLLYLTSETGIGRGFIRYEDHPVSPSMVLKSSWLWRLIIEPIMSYTGSRSSLVSKTAAALTDDVVQWLNTNTTRPFFLFVNYFDAHEPYAVPSEFDARFGASQPRPWSVEWRMWSDEQKQIELDAYDSAIAYIDRHLGVLFRELTRRGLLDNTVVIVTSDHGELFGEHGLFSHANSLYRPLLHVPLVIVFPTRVPASTRVGAPVTLRDLPATVADLVALPGRPFPGSSLATHWIGTAFVNRSGSPILAEVDKAINAEAWLPVARGRMRSVVRDGHHYILSGDGSEELYDFINDPAEGMNLARVPSVRDKLLRIRAWLQTLDHTTVNASGPDGVRSKR